MANESVPHICVVGSCNVDLISYVPRLPVPGETLVGSKFQVGFGGKGANQAVMAAKLGADVRMVARIGRDVFGSDTLRNFREQHVDATFIGLDDTLSSGVAPILVDMNTGQNAIAIVPGANFARTANEIRAAAQAIQTADVVICQLEILIEATLEAFRVAKEAANPPITLLNPAPAAALPEELLGLTDILIPNEIEAAMLTGMPTNTEQEAEAAARALQARGTHTDIITLGERGALFVEGDAPAEFVAAERVEAVDSTGAGDAFVGSLAYLIGQKYPLREAVEKACAIATLSVMKSGTQTSFPTRDDVAHILSDK